jgi:uncharacterized protein (TIGR03790 family)
MKQIQACRWLLTLGIALVVVTLSACNCQALDPAEVLVVANSRVVESIKLAKYYMKARSIPKENLLIIETTDEESCSRPLYEHTIRQPVLQFLRQHGKINKRPRIHCIVTMYGLPLKITAQVKEKNAQTSTRAAVDSELALVLSGTYPHAGWLPNPYFLGFQGKKLLLKRDLVLLISRLDGPDPKTVYRLIDDSLQAEKTGLQGTACIDARWKKSAEKNLQGYALYDASLHNTAALIKTSGRLQVRLDSTEQLFSRGDCPQTALYCGWYNLASYVDAFDWRQGSIGYHIASAECATLKQPKSNVWCKRMLEDGITATIGPVYEPYVQGFPLPEIFFGHLIDGYLSLGESYLISLPYLSWQMVLIGDPLYQPFKPMEK